VLDQLPDEPSAPVRSALISCPSCGAPCSLGFGDEAVCVSCQTRVPLSPEIQQARERRREESRKRRQADPYLRRALAAKVSFWRSPTFIAPISYIAPFLAAAMGYQFGYQQNQYGQAGFVWLIGIGLVHFLTSALLESRKDEQLRALLLSQPGPLLEDGTRVVVCRVCAAPLPIPPGRPGSEGSSGEPQDCSCDHCGADNILAAGPGTSQAPRPDLFDAEAVFREVFGDEVNQRASRLYPLTIFLGFVLLAVLTFFAVEAPRSKIP
jgi:hypothetical protein